MQDASISAVTVVAYVFWTISAVFIGLELFGLVPLGQVGVLLCTIACTVQVRGFIADLDRRERTAFNLGRGSARASVRDLH